MRITRILCGVILTGCSGVGFACDMPKLMVIPATEKIAENAQAFYMEWQTYKTAMEAFVTCTRTALEAAGGDNAPALTRSVLVKRHNDAIAELTNMGKLYDERVEPLVKEAPPQTIEVPFDPNVPQ